MSVVLKEEGREREQGEAGKQEEKRKERESMGDCPRPRNLRDKTTKCDVLNLSAPYSHKSVVKRSFETIGHICLWNRNYQENKSVSVDVIMAFVIIYENVFFYFKNAF